MPIDDDWGFTRESVPTAGGKRREKDNAELLANLAASVKKLEQAALAQQAQIETQRAKIEQLEIEVGALEAKLS